MNAFGEEAKALATKAIDDTNTKVSEAVDLGRGAVTQARDITTAGVKALGEAPLIGETVKGLSLELDSSRSSRGSGGGGDRLPSQATQEEMIAHRHKQLKQKFDGDDGPWHPGPDATMEELSDYRAFLLLEQGMDSPSVTNHALQKYVVVNPAILRAGFELNSAKNREALRVGEIIDAIETAYNEDGTLRIRCTKGWASASALDGTVLLQAIVSEEEAIAQAARESALAEEQHRAEEAARASAGEFKVAQVHMDGGNFILAAEAYQRAGEADPRDADRAFNSVLAAARAAIGDSRFNDAVEICLRSMELQGTNVETQDLLDEALQVQRGAGAEARARGRGEGGHRPSLAGAPRSCLPAMLPFPCGLPRSCPTLSRGRGRGVRNLLAAGRR